MTVLRKTPVGTQAGGPDINPPPLKCSFPEIKCCCIVGCRECHIFMNRCVWLVILYVLQQICWIFRLSIWFGNCSEQNLCLINRSDVDIFSDFNSDLKVNESTVVCVIWRFESAIFYRVQHISTPPKHIYNNELSCVTYDVLISLPVARLSRLHYDVLDLMGKWFDCRVCLMEVLIISFFGLRFEAKSRRKWPVLSILVRTVLNILSDFMVTDSTVVCVSYGSCVFWARISS